MTRHVSTSVRAVAVACLLATLISAAPQKDELFQALRSNDIEQVRRLITAGAPVAAEDEFGSGTLAYAALYSGTAVVRLLLEKGADPNHADRSGATALIAAISDLQKVRMLVAHGANVNAVPSLTGRTPLLIACGRPGNGRVVRFLLNRGADPNVADIVDSPDHREKTPLLAAAASGDPDILRTLLDRGLNANQQSGFFTPLSLAAFTGSRKNVEVLLARGAVPGQSPVLLLALTDRMLFRTLLDKGADPRVRGILGIDALTFAAAHDNFAPEVARELLRLGLDPTDGLKNLHTDHGYGTGPETALDWARRHGDTPVARILARSARRSSQPTVSMVAAEPTRLKANSPKAAVEKALPRLYAAGGEFFKRSGCVSCHHNMVPAIAFSVARANGIAVADDLVRRNSQQSAAYLKGNQQMLFHGVPLSGTDSTIAYILWGLSADNYPHDRSTDAAVYHLAVSQRLEGWWRAITGRPPMESNVSATAIAIRALRAYPLPGRTREFKQRVRRAANWLAVYSPGTGEERSMRVLGLAWADPHSARVRIAAQRLIAKQRPDGGWAQLDTLDSDAYATGQALYALSVAGHLPNPALHKGIRFLLETQLADGSWHVRSRSYPVQSNYFDTGFPHGRDQWISAAATGWACIGLATAATRYTVTP